MKNLLNRPLGELLTKNPLVDNYKKMWPFVKPYWFRAVLGLLLALTDQDGEAADIQSTDTVKVTFFDCRNEIVQEFTFTGVTGNHIEMEFTDEISRKFPRGRYHYDILYTHADKTTLVRGNTAIVE